MNHFDNVLFFPILDSKVRFFDMVCLFYMMIGIDDIDVSFIVFKNCSKTSRVTNKAFKYVKQMKKEPLVIEIAAKK